MCELAIMVLRFFSCLFVFFVASKTTIAYDLFSSHKKHKKAQNGPDTTWIVNDRQKHITRRFSLLLVIA